MRGRSGRTSGSSSSVRPGSVPRRSALSVSATDLASHKPAASLLVGQDAVESCLSCVSFQALTPSLLWRSRRRVLRRPQGHLQGQLAADENGPQLAGVIGETDTLAGAVVRCGSYHCCAFIQDDLSAWCWVNPTETKSARMFSFTAMRFSGDRRAHHRDGARALLHLCASARKHDAGDTGPTDFFAR